MHMSTLCVSCDTLVETIFKVTWTDVFQHRPHAFPASDSNLVSCLESYHKQPDTCEHCLSSQLLR